MPDKMLEAEEGAPAKKKSKLLLIIILVVVLAVLGGGGYYAYITFLKAKPAAEAPAEGDAPKADGEKKAESKKEEPKKEEPKKDEKKEGSAKDKKPLVTSIQNIITNLADPGGRRYVKLSVDFDFDNDTTAREFEEKYQAKVKDAILTLLWSKTSEDLSGIEGMQTFKMEIQSRVNQIMGQGKVKNVFITERVIQ